MHLIRTLSIVVAAGLLLGAAPAPNPDADPSMAQPVPTKLKGYLAADALDGKAILPPPPAVDSPSGKADRAIYDENRALAGTPRWTAAQRDNDLWSGGAQKRVACALGRDISEATTPRTQQLLHRVELDARGVSGPAKRVYNRTRPLIGDTKPVCVPREDWLQPNPPHPSGHPITRWACGQILAEAAPDKRSAMIVAGRDLGAAMVARLHAVPKFLADLRAAKAELAKAPAPKACPVP
jgi:acid phosphatase (class A)